MCVIPFVLSSPGLRLREGPALRDDVVEEVAPPHVFGDQIDLVARLRSLYMASVISISITVRIRIVHMYTYLYNY